MTALEQIATALEHARPNVKGAALEREVDAALDVARQLVRAERAAAARVRAGVAELLGDPSSGVRQTACRFCSLDIEGVAPYRRGEWRDRGNNPTCPTPEGDVGRHHAPVRQ